jgi:hypothetical protein
MVTILTKATVERKWSKTESEVTMARLRRGQQQQVVQILGRLGGYRGLVMLLGLRLS